MSSDRDQMRRLQSMAGLVADARSQTLREANDVLANLQQQLKALDAAELPRDLPWPAPEMALFGYEQWAARRRAEINLRMAAQRILCMQARDAAQQSFGRKMALEKVIAARKGRQLS